MRSIEDRRDQTEAARQARWPGTVAERKQEKTDRILLTIAGFGWATLELVNYYLCQSSQAWPAELEKRGLLFRQKIIVGAQTKSRTQGNGHVMTILLLSDAGQRRVRYLNDRIGNRIRMPSMGQARHDLLAFWAAAFAITERTDMMQTREELEIYSDQVMRSFREPYRTDETYRPDASVYRDGSPILHIEVERSKKKTGREEYVFLRKLRRYTREGVETLIVTESQARATSILELLRRAETTGVEKYYQNDETKCWFETGEMVRYRISSMVAIWDHESKTFTHGFPHNC